MHGLCFRAMQSFLRERYGDALWQGVAQRAALPEGCGTDALAVYDGAVARRLVRAAAKATGHEAEALLEDLGTFLVFHPACAAIRRLLRFGGADFAAFLLALEDLPERARLAVADLHLPDIEVREAGGEFRLSIGGGLDGFGAVVAGLVRAMADDYGTLVVLGRTSAALTVRLVDADYAQGRGFALAG